MLLEMALADFSEQRERSHRVSAASIGNCNSGEGGSSFDEPGWHKLTAELPVQSRKSSRSSTSSDAWGRHEVAVLASALWEEGGSPRPSSKSSFNEGGHEVARSLEREDEEAVANSFLYSPGPKRTTRNAATHHHPGQFLGQEECVAPLIHSPAAKGNRLHQQEESPSPKTVRVRPNPESLPLPLPPSLRAVAISRSRIQPGTTTLPSPNTTTTAAGKMKSSTLDAKSSPAAARSYGNIARTTTAPPRIATADSDSDSDCRSAGIVVIREDNRDHESQDSDDGENSSPVSTLDCPRSPTPSPDHDRDQAPAAPPAVRAPAVSVRTATRPAVLAALPTGSSTSLDFPRSPVSPDPAAAPAVRRPEGGRAVTATEMADELPAVMEEDEEVCGFHTMEFRGALDSSSPGTSDRSLSGRHVPSKSFGAPISRQSSSLRPGPANLGRRRSDFDWPEDFDERAEEVVKEVDEALWAFSPVASTFLFTGNGRADDRSPGPGLPGGPPLTPSVSSASLSSGSMREGPLPLPMRRSLMRAVSSKPSYGAKAEAGSVAPFIEMSARLRHYSMMNGDDDFAASTGNSMKRSFSCMPFFSLCKTQRPTPALSFSQRLNPCRSPK